MFHLLGQHEDDMTYALGWALSRSPRLARLFMELAFGTGAASPTTIKLQETVPGHGRTDVELESDHEHLIIEAKRGWDVPREGQLEQYAPRLADGKTSQIVVLTEATAEHAAAHHLPTDVAGAPVSYVAWRQIADLARDAFTASRRPVERAVLDDLHTYVRSFATMRDVTSNLVYVVSLGTEPLGESGLSFADIVMERDLYFCPVGYNGWPKDPPTYLGFRFDGQLQRVSYVRGYQVVADPERQGMPGLPELEGNLEWTGKDGKPLGHWLFSLDPAIPLPREVRSGPHARNRRVTAALDLLLTSDTVLQAAELTRERLDGAGASGSSAPPPGKPFFEEPVIPEGAPPFYAPNAENLLQAAAAPGLSREQFLSIARHFIDEGTLPHGDLLQIVAAGYPELAPVKVPTAPALARDSVDRGEWLDWPDLGLALERFPEDRDRRDYDHGRNPNIWRVLSCGPRVMTTSSSGMHLRGVRWVVALDTQAAEAQYVACEITKGYASGGRSGLLRQIATGPELPRVVDAIRSQLEMIQEHQEVLSRDQNLTDPGWLSVEQIAMGLETFTTTGTPGWSDLDRLARSLMSGPPEDGWADPDEPCVISWFLED